MEWMIEGKNIVKKFPIAGGEEFVALKGIDIQVPKGKLTILRGSSGSGKTTLMNILGALDNPTEGELFFDGENITNWDEEQYTRLRRSRIGFVFQSVALIPMMSAYENVEYSLRLANYEGDFKARTEECLKMVGLGARMEHMPEEMSGGEQQRVAIARAIAHKPGVIFADEPTAELDSGTGLQVVKSIKKLVEEEHITVIMTTHDIGLMEVGDMVYQLEDGEMIRGE